jgi:hypothetical protein
VTSRSTEIIVDSSNPPALARWWAEVLRYRVVREADEGWLAIAPWDGDDERAREDAIRTAPQVPTIVFVPVPEAKTLKNRVHLDIWSIDGTQAEEVERLLQRGATWVDVGQRNVSWVVMADPEGNEFCVL